MTFQWRSGADLLEQAILAALLVCIALFLTYTDWLWRWDRILLDTHLKFWSRPASNDIVIVAIDEASLWTLGRWPWPRGLHAELIERLTAEQPRVIAIDLIFAEADLDTPEEDIALAKAIKASHRTVLPVFVEQPRLSGQLIEQLPISPLAEAATALGHVHVELDKDGIARGIYLKEGLGTPHWPTLSVAILDVVEPNRWTDLPGARNPNNHLDAPQVWIRDHHILIPFAGPPGHFSRISYVQALRGEFVPETFKDKFVLIGVTATGLGDALPTPVSGQNQPMPGVEINANILDALRRGITIQPLGMSMQIALAALLGVLPILIYPRLAPRWSLAAAGLLLLLVVSLSTSLLVTLHLWFAPAPILLVVVLSYPLWSWRRLEAAMRYLDRELDRLRTEQEAVPPTKAPRLETALSFLSQILPIGGWVIQEEKQTNTLAESNSIGAPPVVLSFGDWMQRGENWWVKVAFEGQNWLIGLHWLGETLPDSRQQKLMYELVRPYMPTTEHSPSGTVEVLQARIQQVQEATERLQMMHHFIDDSLAQMDGVLVTSSLGQVVLANQQAAFYLSGSRSVKLQGKQLLDLLESVEPLEGMSWKESLRRALVERTPVQLNSSSHSGRDLLIQMVPLDSDQHRLHGLIMNLSDITALKDHERRRVEVLGFLSHDLRSPLVSILALVELAQTKYNPEELLALLYRAEHYARRTLELAEKFLELARAESSEQVHWHDVDLVSVAIDAFEQVWVQAKQKQIELRQDIDVDEAWVTGDHDLLERAIINLLTNAIKYSPEGAKVSLHLYRHNNQLHCCVIDNGYGIAKQDLPRLFSRFGRISMPQHAEEKGIGLGLAFVKAVIDRHGGQVEVDSTLGKGSRFCMIFPV